MQESPSQINLISILIHPIPKWNRNHFYNCTLASFVVISIQTAQTQIQISLIKWSTYIYA